MLPPDKKMLKLFHVAIFSLDMCLDELRFYDAVTQDATQQCANSLQDETYIPDCIITRAWCAWRSRPVGSVDPSAVPRHQSWSTRRSRESDKADRDAVRHETPGWIFPLNITTKLAEHTIHHQWGRNEFESKGAPVRRESGGTDPAQSAGKMCWSCPSTFLALKVRLVVLVSAFMMVSTVSSVSCLPFFYARCPPCPAICKSGGSCPRAIWSWRYCTPHY